MDGLTMRVTGIDKIVLRLEEQAKKFDAAAERVVKQGGLLVANAAKEQFRPRPAGSARKSRTGRVHYDTSGYGVDGPGFDGSFAPNPPKPTNRTGNLQASIKTLKVERVATGTWSSQTGPTMKYGKYVENPEGMYGGRREFPFLRTGYENALPALRELYRKEMMKACL
jgi:hypothetical protein